MVRKKRQTDHGDDCGESTESCEENINQNCLHINKSLSLPTLRKVVKGQGLSKECSECAKSSESPRSVAADEEDWDKDGGAAAAADSDSGLWMCLQCGTQLCSRNKNQHALLHFHKPHSDKHELAANTTNWVVYCYICQRPIPCSSTKKLQEVVEFLKKQPSKERDVNIDDKVAEAYGGGVQSSAAAAYGGGAQSCAAAAYGGGAQSSAASPKMEIALPYSPLTGHSSSPVAVCGLYNFGNTCFFNSVVQCLVQTPYLTTVLRRSSLGGSHFKLEGGKLQIDDREIELPPIHGVIGEWGDLTEVLTTTLEKLSSPGSTGVYRPQPLFNSLTKRFPQFRDGEQHDSHELLRQLLEGVRNEDLRRYQSVVLDKLNLRPKEKRLALDNEKKLTIKFYGQRATEKLLAPEQVFRGFLVSTLECQECQHTSDRTETFLDLSLPVTAEKPQPPAVTRRKGIPEEQNCVGGPEENKLSKHQLKKEQQAKRKARKGSYRAHHRHESEKQGDHKAGNDLNENKTESKSSSEQSDADVEDNLEEPTQPDNKMADQAEGQSETAANFALYHMESGYNSEKLISSDSIRASPVDTDNKEKCGGSPERLNKEEPFCLSAMAIPLEYRPLSGVDSPHLDSGVASPDAGKSDTPQATSKELGSPSSLSSEINMDMSSPRQDVSPDNDMPRPVSRISFLNLGNSGSNNAERSCAVPDHLQMDPSTSTTSTSTAKLDKVIVKLDQLDIEDGASSSSRNIANKYPPNLVLSDLPLNSPESESSKWKKNCSYFPSTVSPRYQCDEGEYSVQSCLNQFTSSELLAGNNKVGCEACTKRANSDKTIYTNATKRFLISSPPAVLILHLKRFQIGPRCMFRKITKHVSFPLVLDIAPFCSDKIKSLPMVSPTQSKLLYSLYAVVEHSGSMHGGHYVAYVKVRPTVDARDKRWHFVPTDNGPGPEEDTNTNGVNGNGSDSSMSGYESGEGASGYTPAVPSGKWYYISDSRVQEISQEKVLNTQAYLLFYERIL